MSIRKRLFVFVVCFITAIVSSFSLFSLVILSHGFRNEHSAWYKPGGDFFEAVACQARKMGHKTMSFSWEQSIFQGGLNIEHRKGGASLAAFIWDYKQKHPHEKIILIVHSYGAFVAYHASNYLQSLRDLQNGLKRTEQTQEHTKYDAIKAFLAQAISQAILGKYLRDDLTYEKSQIQEQDLRRENCMRRLLFALKDKIKYLAYCFDAQIQELLWGQEEQEPLIDELYTLGTPHWESYDVLPDMREIGFLYNLSSKGDLVAHKKTAGSGDLPEELRSYENTKNIYVELNVGGDTYSPGHAEIHSPIVGHGLLYIPDMLDNEKQDEIFTFYADLKYRGVQSHS